MSNPLELSDEDFLKMTAPPSEGPAPVVEKPKVEEPVVTPSGSQEEEQPKQEEKPVVAEAKSDVADEEVKPQAEGTTEVPKTDGKTEPEKKEEPAAAGADNKEEPKAEEQAAPDYEGFYKQIMTPFKANGKMIELRNPDEAIKLMQMGANYTRRMQDIAPHKKVLTMLQNNNLLDEDKLSYLIDLDKKNPDAIKKLVKDSGLDPLDINTSEESAYKPSNHSVTDEEVAFKTALEDIQSKPTGRETLQIINTTWDHASKEALWKSPELLGHIQTQRDNGVYSQIVTEMDRQITLGVIPPNTPFLQAYKLVGDDMMARKAFVAPQETKPEPTVVATRVANPKPAVVNEDKARAASPTKSSPNKAQEVVNPLAMSDEDFLKNMRGRL